MIEVEERYTAQGEALVPITPDEVARLTIRSQQAYEDGIRAVAIAFLYKLIWDLFGMS